MQRPFSYTFAALTLLASAAVPAAEEVTINTPNGRPFVVLRVFDIGESTDKWGEPVTASAVLTDRERQLITSGLEYWGSLLEDGLQNTSPAVIDLIATKTDPDDINASATSLPTGVDDNTLLSALITEKTFPHQPEIRTPSSRSTVPVTRAAIGPRVLSICSRKTAAPST